MHKIFIGDVVSKIKTAVGVEEQQNKTLLGQVDEAMTLSWKTRLIGFGVCFGIGMLFSFISLALLASLQLTMFAIVYTLGGVISVCSTMFLMGPVAQCKKMMDSGRILATIAYFVSMILTLFIAFKTHSAPLCIICIVVQFCMLIWYCLTWVPGGQATLKALIFRGG